MRDIRTAPDAAKAVVAAPVAAREFASSVLEEAAEDQYEPNDRGGTARPKPIWRATIAAVAAGVEFAFCMDHDAAHSI
jgi:hypothetical protein